MCIKAVLIYSRMKMPFGLGSKDVAWKDSSITKRNKP